MTVTLAGKVADVLEELKVTTAPFAPAFLDNVTVPVDPDPPTTLVGETANLETVCAATEAARATNIAKGLISRVTLNDASPIERTMMHFLCSEVAGCAPATLPNLNNYYNTASC